MGPLLKGVVELFGRKELLLLALLTCHVGLVGKSMLALQTACSTKSITSGKRVVPTHHCRHLGSDSTDGTTAHGFNKSSVMLLSHRLSHILLFLH